MIWKYTYVHAYLTMHKRALAHFAKHPDGTVKLQWHTELTKDQYLRDFRKALDRRINLKVRPEPTYRNWSTDQYYRFYRDQQRAFDKNTRRICVYQFETRAAKERLSHMISDREY